MIEITKEEVMLLLEKMDEHKVDSARLDIDIDREYIDFDIFDDRGYITTTVTVTVEKK